jgi:glycosyltransferase involved in cell wall biosynthesis
MRNRVLLICEDPVGEGMGGNAIRSYEIAKALGASSAVTLLAPAPDGALSDVEHVPFALEDLRELRARVDEADVVIALPQNPVIAAELRRCRARVVYDLYDPRPLQFLAAAPGLTQRFHFTIALDHVMGALASGDYFVCASERQRDLWIGAMLACGLVTPERYRADPTLRNLIDVVPFGIPDAPPDDEGSGPHERFPMLDEDAEIVLWNGGLWNWFDPVGAVEAMQEVVLRRPRARLLFMGRPPLESRDTHSGQQAKQRAGELGLLETVVFFNDAWIPYNSRAAWLLSARCALSMHLDHLETRYSFRTRILDCFWAGLPVVCTRGDEFADLVDRAQLGASVPAADPAAAAQAVVEVLSHGREHYSVGLARVAEQFRWSAVTRPLRDYVANPDGRTAPRRRAPFSPARSARAAGTRAVRWLLRSVGH